MPFGIWDRLLIKCFEAGGVELPEIRHVDVWPYPNLFPSRHSQRSWLSLWHYVLVTYARILAKTDFVINGKLTWQRTSTLGTSDPSWTPLEMTGKLRICGRIFLTSNGKDCPLMVSNKLIVVIVIQRRGSRHAFTGRKKGRILLENLHFLLLLVTKSSSCVLFFT